MCTLGTADRINVRQCVSVCLAERGPLVTSDTPEQVTATMACRISSLQKHCPR